MKVLAKLSCVVCAEKEIVSQSKFSSGLSSKQEPHDFWLFSSINAMKISLFVCLFLRIKMFTTFARRSPFQI